KLAVSGGQDKTVCLWNVEDGKEVLRHADHKGWVYCVAVCPDKTVIVSGGADGRLVRKALSSAVEGGTGGKEGYSFRHTEVVDPRHGGIYAVNFYRNGGSVVTGSDDKAVRLWQSKLDDFLVNGTAYATGRLTDQKRFDGHAEPVRSVAVSPDG